MHDSFDVALNFIRARGKAELERFKEMCIKGKTLREIGKEFKMSPQRVGVLRSQLLERGGWHYSKSTTDALEFDRHQLEHSLEETQNILDENGLRSKSNIFQLDARNHRA